MSHDHWHGGRTGRADQHKFNEERERVSFRAATEVTAGVFAFQRVAYVVPRFSLGTCS
jgi:hypothetical protein